MNRFSCRLLGPPLRLLFSVPTFVQLLGHYHGFFGGELELAPGGLLQRACGERRVGALLPGAFSIASIL